MTYPKSGTTWMQYVCYLITVGDQKFRHLKEVFPSMATATSRPFTRVSLFKSHMRLSDAPRKCRRIYVYRDPRDVCVSYFHQAGSIRQGMTEFVERFVRGALPFGSWWDHVQDAAKELEANPERVLFVRYEDALGAPHSEVGKIAEFLGVNCPVDRVREIVEMTSFSQMSAQAHTLSPLGVGRPFFREGVSGSWKKELTPEHVKLIQSRITPASIRLQGP